MLKKKSPLETLIADATLAQLDSGYRLIDNGYRLIVNRGFMSMRYKSCAIGVVAQGARMLGLDEDRADEWGEEPMRFPLTVLDEIAKENGAYRHDHHVGAWIEGYGQYNVDWSADQMALCYERALKAILHELNQRGADEIIKEIAASSPVELPVA